MISRLTSIFAVVTLLCLTACGSKTEPTTSTVTKPATPPKEGGETAATTPPEEGSGTEGGGPGDIAGTVKDKPKRILSTEPGNFPVTRKNPKTGKTWTILGIMTDTHNFDIAKANCEDTLVNYPDIACMVGLWAYNPPKILQAVKDSNKVGKVKIVGFDEDPDTLQGIEDGSIEGTIVQNPYGFGFKSTEYLAALVREQKIEIPEDKIIFVPTQVITKDNVETFKDDVQAMRDGKGPILKHGKYDTEKKVQVAFLTNSVDPFWELAKRGCERAEGVFNAKVEVLMPPTGQVEEQKRMMEEQITLGTKGLAISPIDPANQEEMINNACEKMKVITQDSDAPTTNRIFYIGTDNYTAGRQAGELVAKACPEGGKVMVFVGKMEVLNAQERSQGVVDVLLGQ